MMEKRPLILPTPRALFLLLTIGMFWAASGLVPFLVIFVPFLMGWVVLTLIADIRRTPDQTQIELQRHHHHKMSIRADNLVEIVVQNHAKAALDVLIRDEPPVDFKITKGSPMRSAQVKGNNQFKWRYDVRPTRRGDHAFGNLNIRWTSVLGLFVRQAVYPIHTVAKVYPNLLQISQSDRLARQGHLPAGARMTRMIGEMGMFEQLREYVPDDDYRRISWKATAKHGKLISVDYSPEQSQNIVLLIDVGQQMMTRPLGVLRTTRLDLVVNAVLMFAYTALTRGDRVGLLIFGDTVKHYVAPRSGDRQFFHVVEALYDVKAEPVDPNYNVALGYLRAQRQRRSLLVLLTDPGSQIAAHQLVGQLGSFYPHHLPLCVILSDVAVLEAARRSPYSVTAIYERAVAEQILDQRQLWLAQLHQRGVMTLDVPAYHLTSAVINKYLELKQQGRI